MKIVIIAGGVSDDVDFLRHQTGRADYVICCDSGANHALAAGIAPDVVIGDFDSINVQAANHFSARGVAYVQHPRDKDATDLELAMGHALDKSPTEIVVLCAFGGRFDHFLGNIHALVPAAMTNYKAYLLSNTTRIEVFTQQVQITRGDYIYISLIPLTTDVEGIHTSHLKYPLTGETLCIGTTRGLSNEFTADTATIRIDKGILCAICTKAHF